MRKFLAAALLGGALAMSVSAAFADEDRPLPPQTVAAPADMQAPGYSGSGDNSSGVPGYPITTNNIQNQ